MVHKQDALWKIITEDIFHDFTAFFLPEVHAAINFSQGVDWLDKELESLFNDSEETRRHIDKLAKVRLKDGQKQYLLIHADIQGYDDSNFAKRMFTYYYRVFDRYQQPITALAVFTDVSPKHRYDNYNINCFDTELNYKYSTYNIWQQSEQELIDHDNPFAIAVLAARYVIKSHNNGVQRLEYKKQLAKLLKLRQYDSAKSHALFLFIDGILRINKKLELKFKDYSENLFKGDDQNMPIPAHLTNYGQIMYDDGLKKGKDDGEKKGFKKGKCEMLISQLQKN